MEDQHIKIELHSHGSISRMTRKNLVVFMKEYHVFLHTLKIYTHYILTKIKLCNISENYYSFNKYFNTTNSHLFNIWSYCELIITLIINVKKEEEEGEEEGRRTEEKGRRRRKEEGGGEKRFFQYSSHWILHSLRSLSSSLL